jgi:hypothetical protein
MNLRDTLLLATPTVPAIFGSTVAYFRVDTPFTKISRTRSPRRGSERSRWYAGIATSPPWLALDRSRRRITESLRSASTMRPRSHETSDDNMLIV